MKCKYSPSKRSLGPIKGEHQIVCVPLHLPATPPARLSLVIFGRESMSNPVNRPSTPPLTRQRAQQQEKEVDMEHTRLLKSYSGETDPGMWLQKFEHLASVKKWEEGSKLSFFPLYLESPAATWYFSIPARERDTFEALKKLFLKRSDSQKCLDFMGLQYIQ